jgi:hypothetical protein
MTLKDRILIPFEGGFAEVENERPVVGEEAVGILMRDGKRYGIRLKPVDDGDQAIICTKPDGDELVLKCVNVFRIAAISGKLQQ